MHIRTTVCGNELQKGQALWWISYRLTLWFLHLRKRKKDGYSSSSISCTQIQKPYYGMMGNVVPANQQRLNWYGLPQKQQPRLQMPTDQPRDASAMNGKSGSSNCSLFPREQKTYNSTSQLERQWILQVTVRLCWSISLPTRMRKYFPDI